MTILNHSFCGKYQRERIEHNGEACVPEKEIRLAAVKEIQRSVEKKCSAVYFLRQYLAWKSVL